MLDPQKGRVLGGSFRDPSGFVFSREGSFYRQVNIRYAENYDHLMRSGLYDALVSARLLIPHEQVPLSLALNDKAYQIIRPERIPFTSYPYEWCFSEIKDAALLTLKIQSIALEFEMSLKDASPYNVQFKDGRPIFIDTLSFAKSPPGEPWVAYRQFCELFLAPLALISKVDVRLPALLRSYLDGIPLDLASKLLPIGSYANFGLLSHVHLHAIAKRLWANKRANTRSIAFGRTAALGLVDSLCSTVGKLGWKQRTSEWSDYYHVSSYSPGALEHKRRAVGEFMERINPAPTTVWDLGANTGMFSRVAINRGAQTVAFDADPAAVEQNYSKMRADHETNLLPLMLDLRNPSPSLGWAHQERISLVERGPADLVFALALIHHLAISNNLPFTMIAEFLSRICTWLIIEFVPRDDSQVRLLLMNRKDDLCDYDQSAFRSEFAKFFSIEAYASIPETDRVLYLMKTGCK